MEKLTADAVLPLLKTKWLGQQFHHFESVSSTNSLLQNWLAERPSSQLPAGTLLVTEFQSQGRGRYDRRWEAPPGSSLLLSLLFRPQWPASQAHWITMLASTAAAAAITAVTGIPIDLKWPNDLMSLVKGQWRKTGGLLQEGSFHEEGRLETVILGIGININIPAGALPQTAMGATSLMAVSGQPVSRSHLLVALLQRMEAAYEAAESGQSPHLAWQEKLMTLDQAVSVHDPARQTDISGTAVGVDEWGRLQVKDESGETHLIAAGDVTLRRAGS